ncbi:hypothetical protein J6590_003300 [Homalodisca vitripennis]|nr:hypothetical protein J6590_003300 [Homalodisca vitripennis]
MSVWQFYQRTTSHTCRSRALSVSRFSKISPSATTLSHWSSESQFVSSTNVQHNTHAVAVLLQVYLASARFLRQPFDSKELTNSGDNAGAPDETHNVLHQTKPMLIN